MTLRPYWLAVGWLLVAAVCWFSLTPSPLETGIRQGDKLGHLLAYLSLVAWWGQLEPRGHRLWLIFLLMGMALEGLQGLTPQRKPSLHDLFANITGASLGWLATRQWPDWLARLERPWAK
jgi:VanZ family protein